MTLTLPWPPSTNTAYATVNGRRVKTKRASEYAIEVKELAAINSEARRLRSQAEIGRKAGDPFPRFAVTIEAFPPDRRRRDIANLEKLVIDALFEYLVLDDSLIDDLHLIRRELDPPSGRIEVSLREAD